MLRRYLRQVAPSPEMFDQMPFQELIRTGNVQGLLRERLARLAALSRHAGEDQPHLFGRDSGGDRRGIFQTFWPMSPICAMQLQRRLA